ncbi:hypothetical protein BLA60_25845 [Actinophytocola xinjiangensis]|uniref:Tail assembly chaperone n=1 Tax=Actinophytocola xinjiangensis TaxID=485602 RepID=A0A7Z0WI43_9PSEU|nr:hypothetical protein [Actinophytocola xinjiangensis]OLF07755.1 hypothetical protein BLA60_25845 [Actinophytocola xinjiangensis]
MARLDKSALLKRQRADKTAEVDLGEGTVTVRGLTRGEVTQARAAARGGGREVQIHAVENHFIAAGMVDPVMTAAEVAEWLENAPAGDGVAVMEAIQELSGMAEGAQKSGVPRT